MTTREEYPKPSLTADTVVLTRERPARVLLIKRGGDPFAGSWAVPGGFVDEGERAQDAARRELEEETGMRASGDLRLVGLFDDPERDPRGWVVSVAFLVEIDSAGDVAGADDAKDAAWFEVTELPELAFDHDQVIAAARSRAGDRPS